MHKFTNARGEVINLPVIKWDEAERLDSFGIVDLFGLVESPDKWESFFERLASDRKFIVNVAYVLLHESAGSDEQQTDFARSLFSEESGSECLLRLSESLRLAVVDFFPEHLRDAIHQHWSMTVTAKALETISHCLPELGSMQSDLATAESGLNQCSELFGNREKGSRFGRFVNASMGQPTTTE